MSRPSFRPRRLLEVEAAYQAFLDAGFPVTFEGVSETLQVGRDSDKSNWLIFKGALDDAVGARAPLDGPSPLPIRCTSNNSYSLTLGEALTVISDMRAWGFAALGNSWRLKDALNAAQTGEALNAVDLTEGWP